MSSRIPCTSRIFSGGAFVRLANRWLSILAAVMFLTNGQIARAQDNASDPSEMFLKAFTSVQQGEKLESEGRLRPALAKYRFSASLLEQLSQSNPNWQPLIVHYRIRKTTENIQKLEEKIQLQPAADLAQGGGPPAVNGNANPGAGGKPGRNDPGEDDPLPSADVQPGSTRQGRFPSEGQQQMPSAEALNGAAVDLRAKLDKTQKDLNDAVNQLSVLQKEKKQAQREKQDIEFQLHSARSGALAAQKRFDRTKADRDEVQSDLDKAEARLKEVQSKNPQLTGTRKELSAQVADLKKALAKAQADNEAAAKSRDTLDKKADAAEKPANEGDAPDAAKVNADAAKIQSLEAENAILTQKLAVAETSIADLQAESARKKEELDGVRKELGTLKDQLATTRDQNDRSATTITDLRKQLDENADQLTQLKAKGVTNEDSLRLTKENELLRGIVVKQLKDQARRDQARELLKTELARLEVQSRTLNEQVEVLGRPAMRLTDEEAALFKEPQVSISDSSADSTTMAASITAMRPRTPESLGAKAADGKALGDTLASALEGGSPSGSGVLGVPKVETTSKPKVAEPLVPMAREARDDFDKGHYPEAEKVYEKLLAREPKNPYLLSNQGVVLFRQDKLKSAEVMLRKAVTISPMDAFSQAILGIVYYKMHRYDEAISSLTQAIQLDPKNATAHNYLGITSSQKGWPEAAVDELEKAIALNPNYADAHFNLAVIYATNQPPDKARAAEHYKIATALGATPDPALEKLLGN